MANSDRYAVQTYLRGARGKFSAGRAIACKNADEARRRAQQCCSGNSNAGAAAFLLRGDEDIGCTDEPITIAIFGVVPPEVTDDIPF